MSFVSFWTTCSILTPTGISKHCAYVNLYTEEKNKLAKYIVDKRHDIEDEERYRFFVGGEKRVVNDVIDELATYYFEYMMVMCNSEKGSAGVFRFTKKNHGWKYENFERIDT